MDDLLVVMVWPTPENYARFREVCGDDVPDTYVGFLAMVAPRVREAAAKGHRIQKCFVDPDEMAEWCIATHGKVDTEQRAAFALHKTRMLLGEGSDTEH